MTRDAQQGEYIITEMRLRGLQAIYGIAEETIAEVMTRPHTPAPETDNQKMSRELRIATSLYKEGRKDGERTATLAENKRVLDAIEKFKTEAWARHDPCDGGFTKFYQSLRVTEESLRRTAQEHP